MADDVHGGTNVASAWMRRSDLGRVGGDAVSWPLVKLGDVCERVSVGHVGATSEFYTDKSGVPFLRTQNVSANGIVFEDVKYITHKFHQSLKKSTLAAGDVVMSRVVSASVNCGIVPDSLNGANCANIILTRPVREQLDSKYLVHYLRSTEVQGRLLARQVGSAQSVVNTSVLKSWEIPLPPLAEQKRIVGILDKADAIRPKRQQAIQVADDFLRAVFLDMFGDSVTNPKGWEVKSVADLIRAGVILQVQDGNHGNDHPKVSDFTENGIPFVTANVVRRGKILFDQCYYLDHSWFDRLRIGFAKPRDVLISHKGSLGFTAVLDDTYQDYIFSPQTTYYRVNEERLLPEYLKGYFDSGFFQRLFAKEGIQSTRAYLGITRQKDLPIMIPDMSAQMRYMEVLSKYKELSGKLFEPTARSEFFSSLSQKAFRGDL